MIPRRLLWKRTSALFLAVLVGCSTLPRGAYVEETGQGKAVVHVPRTADLQPVVLEEEEFQQAIRRLTREVRLSGMPRQTVERMFQMDPQFGNYLYLREDKKLVPVFNLASARLLLLAQKELPLVNVNFPTKPRGIAWTRQSFRHYDGKIIPAKDPMGRTSRARPSAPSWRRYAPRSSAWTVRKNCSRSSTCTRATSTA